MVSIKRGKFVEWLRNSKLLRKKSARYIIKRKCCCSCHNHRSYTRASECRINASQSQITNYHTISASQSCNTSYHSITCSHLIHLLLFNKFSITKNHQSSSSQCLTLKYHEISFHSFFKLMCDQLPFY